MAPLNLLAELGTEYYYLIIFLIGGGFGIVLEQAGFGNSMKLAAQFYFRDFRVIKVMFGAIVTNMLLVFLAAGFGLLDYSAIWVNPTYLIPGIVGGLIMGFGFIIGGFCPGTSLVALATFKLDGLFFVLGVLTGIFFFGETVDSFANFWNSTYMGRATLQDWLGMDPSWLVPIVVIVALGVFKGGEILEKIFGTEPEARLSKPGIGLFLIASVTVLVIGYPTPEERWNHVDEKSKQLLKSRQIFIEPAELVKLYYDDAIDLKVYDFRTEDGFNRFHIIDSERFTLDSLSEEVIIKWKSNPPNRVIVLTGTAEKSAITAWKQIKSYNIPNLYILEGGINHWLEVFQNYHDFNAIGNPALPRPAWEIPKAIGNAHKASEIPQEDLKSLKFEPKVKLEKIAKIQGGGCG